MKDALRSYFILGLLTLFPLVFTLAAIFSLFNWMDSLLIPLFPKGFQAFPGLGIMITFVIILLMGALAKTVLGTVANSWTDALLMRVPFARGIYKMSKQIASALLSSDSKSSFKRVVLVPFPSSESKILAFVTGVSKNGEELTVFVPTSPNPTSGYVLFYKTKDVAETSMTVNEALQLVISCGASSAEGKSQK